MLTIQNKPDEERPWLIIIIKPPLSPQLNIVTRPAKINPI